MVKAAATIEVVAAAYLTSGLSLLATIITATLALATLVGIVYGVKWKVSADTATANAVLWEQNARGEAAKADTAIADKERLLVSLDEQSKTIAELRALPNVEKLAVVMALHEERAVERHTATLAAMHEQSLAVVGLVQQLIDHLARSTPASEVPAT